MFTTVHAMESEVACWIVSMPRPATACLRLMEYDFCRATVFPGYSPFASEGIWKEFYGILHLS